MTKLPISIYLSTTHLQDSLDPGLLRRVDDVHRPGRIDLEDVERALEGVWYVGPRCVVEDELHSLMLEAAGEEPLALCDIAVDKGCIFVHELSPPSTEIVIDRDLAATILDEMVDQVRAEKPGPADDGNVAVSYRSHMSPP